MKRVKDEKRNYQKCNMIKYKLYSLNDESTKILYQQRLLKKLNENILESAETLNTHIYDCIHSAAKGALGEQRSGRKGGKKYIWSEEMEAAIRRKKNSYLRALSTKKPEDCENYKKDRRNVKRLVTHERNRVWDQKCAENDTYIGGRGCTEVWKFLRNVKTMHKDRSPVEIISTG